MSEESQKFLTSTGRVLTLLVVILIFLFAATNYFISSSENRKFLEQYNEIKPGMQESEILTLLGTPHKRSSEFDPGRKEGSEDARKRAAESGATRYLIWYKGTDSVYTVGLNPEGNVVVIETGNK